jgi:hypothetical protein
MFCHPEAASAIEGSAFRLFRNLFSRAVRTREDIEDIKALGTAQRKLCPFKATKAN